LNGPESHLRFDFAQSMELMKSEKG